MRPAFFIRIAYSMLCGMLFACLLWYGFNFRYAHANIAQCSANSTSPSYLTPSSSDTITFNLENNGPDEAVWIRITRPSSNFTFTSAGNSLGFSASVTSNTVTFFASTFSAGTEGSFSVTMTAGSSEVSAQTFTVEMNDTNTEDGAFTCSSSASVEITNNPPTQLEIANVSISNVAHNSVTISFDTGASSTAVIDYGTSEDYDKQTEDSTSATSHSITISGLTANTTYHYKITATGDGSTEESDNATFTTALSALATSTPGPTATPRVTTNTVTLPTPTPTPDKNPPVVTLEKLPDQSYKVAPIIVGNAVDNDAVASVEYTIDNGKTWKRIDGAKGLKSTTATYSFSPTGLASGEAKIKVRAKDTTGNTGTSAELVLTIDQTGPTLSLGTDLSKPFEQTPEITGNANDPSGESTIEYSIDGEKNWIQVDSITIETETNTRFRFTPPVIDDGNYPISIRATDPLGNISSSLSPTLIVDRLPPRVGGFMLSIGPQILDADTDGYHTLPELSHSLHVSVIGGPTEVIARLVPQDRPTEPVLFPFHRLSQMNVWNTDISLPTSGAYTLELYAKDGAHHELVQQLTTIIAAPTGTVMDERGQSLKTTITLYTKDNLTGSFIPWDAAAYGQQNPQTVLPGETYAFYPPSGTYYIAVDRSFGQAPVVTNSFTIYSGQPVSPQLTLPDPPILRFLGIALPLPSLLRQQITVSLVTPTPPASEWQERSIPEDVLTTIDPARLFSGKQTTLVYLNTWNPQIASYLQMLETIQQHSPQQILAIFPHESKATVELFAKRGGYTIPLRADPDGELVESLPYPAIPTVYTMTENRTVVEQKLQLDSR